MKRILTVFGCLLVVFVLASCGDKTQKKPERKWLTTGYNADFSVEVQVPDTSSKLYKKGKKMNKKMTALELTKELGKGINLGNTMEAYRGWNRSTTKDPSSYETMWGQPVTTPEIFKAYKAAGFDTVRIPVAWTNMMDYENDDYVISSDYLDRVEIVVNYALAAGLYVIINDHWDGQWWGMFGSADNELRQKAVVLYKSMWTQIAVRFKNYSDKLIFEGANEELGSRLNDTTVFSQDKKGTLSQDECYDAVNKINQCFVDVVRATGGNNKYRFLLIPGYDTDINNTISDMYKMPKDTVPARLLISVHYYTPSTYCILDRDASWGKMRSDWGSKDDIKLMDYNFKKMQKFTDKGYGVIIGEYGVSTNLDGNMKDGMLDWIGNLLKNCSEYGYCPVLWDCNTFFKKTGTLGFYDQAMADLYKK